MPKFAEIQLDLDEVNQTELVALCAWAGIPASRAWPREVLVEALRTFTPPDIPLPLEKSRDIMSKWLQRHWDKFRMQMEKKTCPDCYHCHDMQVISCYDMNKKNFKAGK